jgi:hypothetical protein
MKCVGYDHTLAEDLEKRASGEILPPLKKPLKAGSTYLRSIRARGGGAAVCMDDVTSDDPDSGGLYEYNEE